MNEFISIIPMIMAKQNKKVEGPTCACGKTDLYEEWLKNENKKKEASGKTSSNQTEESSSSSDSAARED